MSGPLAGDFFDSHCIDESSEDEALQVTIGRPSPANATTGPFLQLLL